MKLVNLTPHDVAVIASKGTVVIPRYGAVARLLDTVEFMHVGSNGVPFVRVSVGEAIGLPEEKWDTNYIVSRVLACALPDRTDLVFPFREVRDEDGQIRGCEALAYYEPRQ